MLLPRIPFEIVGWFWAGKTNEIPIPISYGSHDISNKKLWKVTFYPVSWHGALALNMQNTCVQCSVRGPASFGEIETKTARKWKEADCEVRVRRNALNVVYMRIVSLRKRRTNAEQQFGNSVSSANKRNMDTKCWMCSEINETKTPSAPNALIFESAVK